MYRAGDRVVTLASVDGSPRKGTVSHSDNRDSLVFVSLDYLEAYGTGSSEMPFREEELVPLHDEVCYG